MSKAQLIDLEQRQLALLKKIIKRYIPNKSVWAYGSRVDWKADEGSDLDLALFDCSPTEISELREALEESDLLISVDVMDWESIPTEFQENIKKKYVVLQGKTELEGWCEVKLGEVCEVNPAESILKGTKVKRVNMNHLSPFDRKILNYLTEGYKGGSKFKNGDTLLARITPCLENGKTAFVDLLEVGEVGTGSTEFIVIRERKGITDKKFLYYFAISKNFRDMAIKSMTGTSGRQRVETDKVISHVFSLPPLPEQKAIAEVLSSLDDKIDLLNRQNKTLEEMAQALFRKWFVEEAEEGWEEISLSDAIEIVGGGTPNTSVSEYWDGQINWLSGKDIAANHQGVIAHSEKTITKTGLENSSARLLPKYSTVISARGTVGKYCMLLKPMAFSQSNYGVMPKFDSTHFFVYLLIAYSVKELQSAAYGCVFDTITINTFRESMIKLPKESIIYEFENKVIPLFKKIFSNQTQIHNLQKLRDTLLPKLMNGAVRMMV